MNITVKTLNDGTFTIGSDNEELTVGDLRNLVHLSRGINIDPNATAYKTGSDGETTSVDEGYELSNCDEVAFTNAGKLNLS